MAHLKKSSVVFRAEQNCLAHAVIIAIARLTNDSNYNAYRQGYKILPVVQHLLETSGIDLQNGGGIPELIQFQDFFKDYRIIVYGGLDCEDTMFDGRIETEKGVYLLYDEVTRHFHVITNITGALAKR
jgi:hypothetical protein